jgi:hypothetical protein
LSSPFWVGLGPPDSLGCRRPVQHNRKKLDHNQREVAENIPALRAVLTGNIPASQTRILQRRVLGFDVPAAVCKDALEFVGRDRGVFSRAIGKVFVDAGVGEGGSITPVFRQRLAFPLPACSEPYRRPGIFPGSRRRRRDGIVDIR